jgi:protein phosphatase 1L
MAFVTWLFGTVWRYCVNVEALVTVCSLAIIYRFVIRGEVVWDVLDRMIVKLELKVTGNYDRVPVDGESIVSAQKTRASWELRRGNVGVFAIQGRRPHMEDRFNVVTSLEHTDTSIYGIFDGHGGEFAADYTEKTLFKLIMVRLLKAALSETEDDLSAMLTEEILSVDEQLLKVEKSTGEVSGTTALVAVLRRNQLVVANVGDSRGVICDHQGNALPLSFDHKPHLVQERRRIKKAGGFISFNGVWRVAGILATSRALGDYPLKERQLVIAEPDIKMFDLEELKPEFMILATDGLWDAFSNDEACAYIRERLDEPHYGAKSIVLQAYYRGSLDNITVMVVNFLNGTAIRASLAVDHS